MHLLRVNHRWGFCCWSGYWGPADADLQAKRTLYLNGAKVEQYARAMVHRQDECLQTQVVSAIRSSKVLRVEGVPELSVPIIKDEVMVSPLGVCLLAGILWLCRLNPSNVAHVVLRRSKGVATCWSHGTPGKVSASRRKWSQVRHSSTRCKSGGHYRSCSFLYKDELMDSSHIFWNTSFLNFERAYIQSSSVSVMLPSKMPRASSQNSAVSLVLIVSSAIFICAPLVGCARTSVHNGQVTDHDFPRASHSTPLPDHLDLQQRSLQQEEEFQYLLKRGLFSQENAQLAGQHLKAGHDYLKDKWTSLRQQGKGPKPPGTSEASSKKAASKEGSSKGGPGKDEVVYDARYVFPHTC